MQDGSTLRQQIGKRLKAERKRLGLIQAEVAQRLDVKVLSIVNYESGLRSPTADQLNVLHEMGMDTHWVVTGQSAQSMFDLREQFALVFGIVMSLSRLSERKISEDRAIELAWSAVDAINRQKALGQSPDPAALVLSALTTPAIGMERLPDDV